MNSHTMMTRSKSRNQLFEEVDQVKPRLFAGLCEWTITKYDRIKKNFEEIKVWIETFDFNKPSLTPVIIMIAAVGLKALFTLFDYITYLEHKYLPEVSYETYHKMLNVYCVLNLILCCFIGRALWLYDENDENDEINDENINIEFEVIDEAPLVVPLVVPLSEAPSVVPLNEAPSVVPLNEAPSVVPLKFTEEEYDEICEFAKNKNMDFEEATIYLTSCHYCGCKNINVNQIYCKERCKNHIADYSYDCYRNRDGIYCAICFN